MKTITQNKSIMKFLFALNLFLLLTLPQRKHFVSFMEAFMLDSFKGKTSNMPEICHVEIHRTSIGHFLNNSTWSDDLVKKSYNNFVLLQVQRLASTTSSPVYVIADDTVSEKTKPSSKARKPTEKAVFVYSHLKKKKVYGHQFVGVILECAGQRFPYYLEMYDKAKQSKIKMVMAVIDTLPQMPSPVIVMGDSWYSANKLIKVCKKKGFQYIGALKTNRIIYPQDKRMGWSISEYAKTLTKDDVRLVTVGKRKYWVYRYEGKLSSLSKSIVLLSWPEDALFNEKALHAFYSTVNLSTEEILRTYTERWTIEVFFRDTKMQFKLNKYQIRSEKGISRFMLLLSLAYVFCLCFIESTEYTLGAKRGEARKEINRNFIARVFDIANSGVPLDKAYSMLNVA